MHLYILLKLGLIFFLFRKKYKKRVIFDILMTIILGVNIIRRMPHFSHVLFELNPLTYFIFAFQELEISIPPNGIPPFPINFGL